MNSFLYDEAPGLAEAFAARGDEIAGHGRTNAERQGVLPEEDERKLTLEATEDLKRRDGRILSVPYPQELNDIPQIVGRKREGAEFCDMIADAFDVMLSEAERRPLVMGIALHGYIMGQPHRIKHLERVLKYMQNKGGSRVWWTTAGAINDSFRSLFQD